MISSASSTWGDIWALVTKPYDDKHAQLPHLVKKHSLSEEILQPAGGFLHHNV